MKRVIDDSQKLMPRIISNVPKILKADVIGWYCERGKEVRITDMGNFVKHTAPKQTL
jgi:hypothetical protein